MATKIAIHPQTLDIREDKPGLKLAARGYFIVKKAEDLVKWPQLPRLVDLILGKTKSGKTRYGSNLGLAERLWADVVLRAVNNIGNIVEYQNLPEAEKQPQPEILPEVKPKEKLGRGNHNARIPGFTLTGVSPVIPVPPQAEVLALEFNKLFAAGRRDVAPTEIKELVVAMNLPTQQDPMRIFRYYFWLLVNAKTLSVTGEVRRDVVTRQNAIRNKLVPL